MAEQEEKQKKTEEANKREQKKVPKKQHEAQDKGPTMKIRRKSWYAILAPKMFNEMMIGETIVYEPMKMIGKTVSYNLANLTNDIKKQNTNVKFAIESVDNNKARTKIIGVEIMPYTVKRLVRRSSTKIEISFACSTSDSIRLRVKPIIVAKSETKKSVRSKIYHMTVNFLTKKISNENYDNVINSLVSHNLQSSLKEHLNKIYPLKTCEIRYTGIEEIKKAEAE